MSPPFGDFQYGIYLQGMGGLTPSLPMRWGDLERAAHDALDPGPRGYLFGGAGSETTMAANTQAFDQWRIVPRMLRGTAERDLSTTVLGTELSAPVMLAPIGVQSICHDEGEQAVARGAAAAGLTMIASTASSFSMEQIAAAGGADASRWYQLYWPNDPELAKSFVARAEKAGYGAIVITLDTPLLGWRPRDLDTAYLPFLQSVGIANYLTDPVFQASLEKPVEEDPQAAVIRFLQVFSHPAATWPDLTALRELTSLPLLLKGILHPKDVDKARDHGIDGVVVSNHGGRQVDGGIAALDALPGVVDAAGDDISVLFDSGIRSGADAMRALCLGAKAVLLGRPYMWGLTLGGAEGVEHVLKSFLAELDLNMALAGVKSVAELDADLLRKL